MNVSGMTCIVKRKSLEKAGKVVNRKFQEDRPVQLQRALQMTKPATPSTSTANQDSGLQIVWRYRMNNRVYSDRLPG